MRGCHFRYSLTTLVLVAAFCLMFLMMNHHCTNLKYPDTETLLSLLATTEHGSTQNTATLKQVRMSPKEGGLNPMAVSTKSSEFVTVDNYVWRPRENMPILYKDAKISINPINLCNSLKISQDVFLLILILSSPGHVKERDDIRQTYGSLTSYKSREIRHVFLLAETDDENLQSKIQAESISNGDIVQFGFKDTYRNLTMKTSAGLAWVERFCPHAKFILKTDDDYMVLPGRMVDYFDSISADEARVLYSGYFVDESSPIRHKSSPYFASWSEYPYQKYPPYITGAGIMMSNNVVNLFRNASLRVPRTPSEDVYLGLLANMSNIRPIANFGRINPDLPRQPSNLPRDVLVFKAPSSEITKKIWSNFTSRKTRSYQHR